MTTRAQAVAVPADPREAFALAHRYRIAQSICRGRHVLDLTDPASRIGPAASAGAALADAASSYAQEAGRARFEVALSLSPLAPQDAAERAGMLSVALQHGGTLILVARDTAPNAALDAVLAGFRHVASFRHRPVIGSLISDARFPVIGMATLPDAPRQPPPVMLWLASDEVLPEFATGILELLGDPDASALASAAPRRANAGFTPLAAARLDAAHGSDGELRARAASLVERLVELDSSLLDMRAENAELRNRAPSAAAAPQQAAFFDIPRTVHEWPLAENMALSPERLGVYDHRPDDDVVLEGRTGQAFLRRFRLLTDQADFAGAADALSRTRPVLHLAEGNEIPDASIVIPIYGQLAYTLNCLDSLFAHMSRYSAEIIVIDDCSPDHSHLVLPLVPGIRYHRAEKNGGFIRSCTIGAAMARGRFMVMLNNDTRVVRGWLDAMLDTFDVHPQAGLAGSKALYPDGVLQEAGGIIWRDGSAWNYGRGDDPNRPAYCYARQADYSSGCSIGVPTELWRDLGGFDPWYTPAYCEDSDLAFRIRQAGRETWYQPRSCVIHYEGRTSGTDVTTGAKAYQVINAKKLYIRWHDTLANHRPSGEAPYLERERGVSRRVLVIDATTPTPDQDAGSVTTTLSMQLLQELGYKVHFVPEDNFLYQEKYTSALQLRGIDCAYAPYELGFEQYIRRYGWSFDLILVFRVTVLERVLDLVRRHAPRAPVLFNNMDLHYLRMERGAEISGDPRDWAAARTMKLRELDLMERVDCTITPSTHELEIIREELPTSPAMVWPFMFEHEGTSVPFGQRRDFIFLGGYRHAPNVDAVTWFVEAIFPLIRRKEKDARFIIAGASPGPEVLALAGPDVIVTGLVPDLRDVFDVARVFVSPLRFGAGVKGKLSAAMSYGLPVVSTSIGAEGMEMDDGTVLIADDPQSIAEACLRLYRDEAEWDRLSQAGQQFVAEKQSLAVGKMALEHAIALGLANKLDLPFGSVEMPR